MRRILAVLLENEAGSLSRVANLFSARGINIESLAVTPTPDETLSRMTIVTFGDDRILEQITKQLHKLVDVVTVVDMTGQNHVEREMALIKLRLRDEGSVDDLQRVNKVYRGRIADVSALYYTSEVVGTSEEIDAYLAAMAEHEVVEVVRSGPLGIARGEQALSIRQN